MCSPYDPGSCLDLLPDPIGDATSSFVHSVLTELANVIANGVKALVGLLSAWILAPSTSVCPTGRRPGSAAGTLVAQLPLTPITGILVGVVITIVLVVQIVLMIFRGAAVVILAGMLQLAASGSFTRAPSPWMGKVTGWMLALIAYKPAAALVYATGLAFMSDKKHPANFVIGIA